MRLDGLPAWNMNMGKLLTINCVTYFFVTFKLASNHRVAIMIFQLRECHIYYYGSGVPNILGYWVSVGYQNLGRSNFLYDARPYVRTRAANRACR